MGPAVLAVVAGALAFGAWVFSTYNWIRAIGHRRPDLSLGHFIFHGMAAFDSNSFTSEGLRYRSRFMKGFLAFFLAVGLGACAVAWGIVEQEAQAEQTPVTET